jgi:hypothetical protein
LISSPNLNADIRLKSDMDMQESGVPSHHSNPNMNPPRSQKLKHHRPLRRKHIRILLLILFRTLLRTQRPPIVHRLSRRRRPRRINQTLRVRRGPELVWLGENA